MKRKLIAAIALFGGIAQAAIVDFDSKDTGPDNYYMASTDGLNTWSDNGAEFTINYNSAWGSWDGITYSDVNNPAVGGYGNQYAVYGNGSDRSGSGVYTVGYYSTWSGPNTLVSFAGETTVNGLYVNNTAYAADSMLNGDGFARAFNTESNDLFTLTIEGFDAASSSVGSVDLNLADYTGASGQIVSDWTWMDLSSLGSNVKSLQFSVASTVSGTPSYFAMDELSYAAIPEPGTITLMGAGFAGMLWFRRRRKYFFG